jgi:hypothetical protein
LLRAFQPQSKTILLDIAPECFIQPERDNDRSRYRETPSQGPVGQAAKAMRDEEMLAEIEDFLEGFNQPPYRGMRINGQKGRYLVIPAWLERAVVRSRHRP